jgi:gluconokinase
MLDKIKLQVEGKLPADFVNNLGKAFDDRCCQYLGVPYEELKNWVLANLQASNEDAFTWSQSRGRKLSSNDIDIWNSFMTKRGWRDEANETLLRRLKENGLSADAGVDTMFDYIEVDEGRAPRGKAL